jgi:5'-3' exonuclease
MIKDDVLLIDLGSIYWAAWHSTANAEICEAHDRTIAHVRKLLGDYKLIAVCCDSRTNFRKALDPSYKANRPPQDSAAYHQLDRVKQTLADDGLLLWECDGLEADDVLATACRAAVKADHNVAIVSADKDLTQLVQLGVSWLSPKTGECLDRAGVHAKFGVWPEQIRDFLAIVGDRSDNVRGVQGVGEKGAAKLLGEYVTLDQLMTAVVTTPSKVATPKVCAALRDALAWLPVTVKLVSLRYDAPIQFAQIYEQRETKTKGEPMSEDDLDPPRPSIHEVPTNTWTQVLAAPEATADTEPPHPPPPDTPCDHKFIDSNRCLKCGWIAKPIGGSHAAHTAEVVQLMREAAPAAAQQARGIVQALQGPLQGHAAPPPAWELGLEPASLGAAFQLAKGMWQSGLYKRFGSAEAIWAVMIRGRELGMGALTSLDSFHVVEGKPTPSAGLLIARAKAHPDVEYLEFVDGDATFATWRGKTRKGEEITLRYTIEEAKDAGLLAPTRSGIPSNWVKRPTEMLRKTAGVQLGRILAPGALQGMYGIEEMGAA